MDVKVKELQARWRVRSEEAFQRMFVGKDAAELKTLTERETLAVLIGRELAAFLLEEHVALDAKSQPADASQACCPKCGQAGERAVGKQNLPARTVTTRAGEINVRRERWRCRKCRVIFFSARCSSGVRDGRIQSVGVVAGGSTGQ